MTNDGPSAAPFTRQQLASLVMGALLLLFGITGFFFSGSTFLFAGHNTEATMFGLELNGVQDFVHVILGIVGLMCATRSGTARAYGVVLAVVGLALFVFGALAVGYDDVNVLSLNWPANIVHALVALVGLVIVFGLGTSRAEADSTARG